MILEAEINEHLKSFASYQTVYFFLLLAQNSWSDFLTFPIIDILPWRCLHTTLLTYSHIINGRSIKLKKFKDEKPFTLHYHWRICGTYIKKPSRAAFLLTVLVSNKVNDNVRLNWIIRRVVIYLMYNFHKLLLSLDGKCLTNALFACKHD